ncbi:hypothetical protein OMP40_27130 [Cohnella rhizosphaerae]|uniref:Uncharacterized protein n=1 Tax=Cohnella rhizosphaerae TaxID=1457232 RepID=A0A9X4KY98_9BACL|nr:hypothetical protein [Cohnella rhizosphaerae]MDG0812596.1 hypothetical protein [Cohnella rhizosphaerae]
MSSKFTYSWLAAAICASENGQSRSSPLPFVVRAQQRRRLFDAEPFLQLRLDQLADLFLGPVGTENDIAALDIRAHVFEAKLFAGGLQLRHLHFIVAADIDAAQQRDLNRHPHPSKTRFETARTLRARPACRTARSCHEFVGTRIG